MTDAASHEHLNTLTRRCEQLRDVVRLQSLIAAKRWDPQLPAVLMKEVTRLLDADRGTLYLYDRDSNELHTLHADGLPPGTIVVPLQMGIIGATIIRRECINLVNAHEHAYFDSNQDRQTGYRTDTLMALPVIDHNDSVLGGLQLINKSGGRFTSEDQSRLAETAARLAGKNARGMQDTMMVREAMEQLQSEIGCDRSAAFRLDEDSGNLVSIFASGAEANITIKTRLGIAGSVALTGKSMLVADPYHDPRFDPSFDRSTGYTTRNILTVPLKTAKNEVLGIIQVINRNRDCFCTDDIDLLESIAGIVAIAFESRRLYADLDQQFHSLLEVMAASLDSRDVLTAGHSQRVAELAMKIGTVLGFDDEDMDVLKAAGMLHDYGKIGVDDAVLRKNGRLDDDEYRHMREHASKTYEILEKVRFATKYRSVPLIAACHHEALDGTGYPRGLHDHEIPFMSKILTVADVFDALTADRHYRKGMPYVDAFAILDQGIDTKFDGRIVDALKKALGIAEKSAC